MTKRKSMKVTPEMIKAACAEFRKWDAKYGVLPAAFRFPGANVQELVRAIFKIAEREVR